MLKDCCIARQNDSTIPAETDACFINNLPPELLSRIFEVGSADDVNTETNESRDDDGDGGEESTDDEGSSDANEFAAFPPPYFPFQILVSHVCRHWRTVAFSTPSLWTSIVVDPEARPPYERVSMLLERSGNLPLDIYVDYGPHEDNNDDRAPSEDIIKFLFSMLIPHIHRWRSMQLYVIDYHHMYSFLSAVCDPSVSGVPQLTTLELCCYEVKDYVSEDLTLFGGSAPLLTRLFLMGVPVNWNQQWIASASNLTALELACHPEVVRPTWAQLATILRNASALVKLSLRQSGPAGDPMDWFIEPSVGSPADLNAPIQLLRVTHFVLALHSEDYAIGLLRKLYLPALKHLILEFRKGDYGNFIRELAGPATSLSGAQEEPWSLLSRLEGLKIGGLPCHTDSIKRLYGGLQNLTSLELSLAWYLPTLFLRVLCTPRGLFGRGDVWLPRLVTLYVSMASADVLRELVQKRKDAGVPLMSLYVEKLDDANKEDVRWLKKNVKTFMSGFERGVVGYANAV